MGLYEALALTPELTQAWGRGADQHELMALLAREHWSSMREHAALCVSQGLTEGSEIERVLGRER